MHCLKNLAKRCTSLLLVVASALFLLQGLAIAQTNAEFQSLRIVKLGNDLAVSAQLKFELPSVVEEAMYKGVSLTFVSELSLTRERWYWFDKQLTTTARQVRVSYQALTRRWRVTPWSPMKTLASTGQAGANLGVQLAQTYETLGEALAVAQRITHWRVAQLADLSDSDYTLQLRYRLDMSQLPPPIAVESLGRGLLGGSGDWSINAQTRLRVNPADIRPDTGSN